MTTHQRSLLPEENKFHKGNGGDGKHYWLTPPCLYRTLNVEFNFDFDPCPFPKPDDFDGLTCSWGKSSYVNPPFGSIMHEGKKKGPTAWARKAIAEHQKGKRVVLVYPIDKWILMLLEAGAKVRNLGDVKWLATEDRSIGKGTGRHIACFVLNVPPPQVAQGDERDDVIGNLIELARVVDRAVEDWGETQADGSCHVIFHKEEAEKLDAILDFFDCLPENPDPNILDSGPMKAARAALSRQPSAGDARRLDFIETEWFYKNGQGRLSFGFREDWDAGKHETLRAAIDAALASRGTK